MAVDGTLKFDTKIDTDGVENGSKSVKEVITKLIKSLENLSSVVTRAFNGIDVGNIATDVQQVEHSIDSVTDSLVDMATDTVQATGKAEASVNELDDALDNITITRWNDVENEIYEVAEVLDTTESKAKETAQAFNDVATKAKDVSQETVKINDQPLEEMSTTSTELNNMLSLIKSTFQSFPIILGMVGERMKNAFTADAEIMDTANDIQLLVSQIDTYKDALASMESNGLYFGDKEYDKAYSELSKMTSKLNDYKKSLSSVDGEQKNVSKSADKASKDTAKVGKSMEGSSKKASSFSKTLNMLGKSLMFSMVFRAFQAVTNAIKEGFQNLAQYSPEANKSISALSTSLQTLKNSFATAFSPILTAITPALQTLINYLSQAITTAGQFFAVFLNGATTFTKAKDAQVDYAKSIKNSAKEASKSLSSIDKLNNSTDTGSAGGATTGTPNPAQMFEEVEIDNKIVKFVEDLKKKLEPTIQAFERLKVAVAPFAENVGMGLKWLYDNVLAPFGTWTISNLIPSFLDLLGGTITLLNTVLVTFQPLALWLWESFLKPIATWTGGLIIIGLNLLTDALYALSDWILANQEAFIKATVFIGSFFLAFKIVELVTFLTPLITTLGALISSGTLWSGILSLLGGLLSALTAPATIIATILGLLIYTFIDLYSSSESFREQIALLGATWMEALEPLATFISTVLTDAWNEILLPVIDFFVKTLIPQLISIFKQLWQKVLIPFVTFMGEVFTPVVKILTDVWTSLWKNVILPIAKAIGGVLKEAWVAIYDILTKTIIPIIGKVIEVLTFLWKNVVNPIIDVLWKSFKPAFDTVFKGIGDLITGLLGALKGLIKFVAGVFTGDWKKAWEGIQEIFKGIFDSLVAIAKTPINLIIDIINGLINGIASGINAVIDSVNAIKFDIPDWVPVFGGNSIGFRLQKVTAPKIPKLAQGAVIPPNSEFMAILGDQKKGLNIETPLQTMLDAFRQANAENGNTGGVIDLTLNLDGKAILKQLIKLDKEHYNATGKPLFT